METNFGYPPGTVRCIAFIDWYEIRDRERLWEALASLEGVTRAEKGRWEWHEGSGDGRRLVAELTLEEDGDNLVLETKREEDADRCSSMLEKAAGTALEFMIGEARHELVQDAAPSQSGGS